MKLAFITPRYGADIATGPEHACRVLAEHVAERHDVEVFTTCANDPRTWKNEHGEGSDRVRGVLVRRFPVTQPHDRAGLEQFTSRLRTAPHSRSDELEWVRRTGPWVPALTEFLRRQQRSYDALVFFSLWNATTVQGLQVAPDRSVVFPYLQLRPELRFGLWADLLASCRGVGLFSEAERTLLRDFVRATPQAEELVGIGIDAPPQQAYPRHQQDPADTLSDDDDVSPHEAEDTGADDYLTARGVPFKRRHRLYDQFALYGGRVEPDNGCEEMLEYFGSYAGEQEPSTLVLMGVKMMKVPAEPFVRMAGVLPDRERMIAYEAAEVTIAPEPEDLLVQPLLESLAVGTPVLANARNLAAVDHCRRGNGGLYYANREEFTQAMRLLSTNARLRARLGENGRNYVRLNFRWDVVLGRFERLISRVKAR